MDTTSNAISRTLSILAAHPEVQDRVRQEILDALEKNEGQDLSYDELVSLPFLDAVCRETLRL
jgi:cytochrome P450